MLEEVDGLTRLVDSLLALARAEPARKPAARTKVDLGASARAVVELMRVLAEEKKQGLELEICQPAAVRGDAATLRQALTNLLDNAIRYTPAGGHVRVSVGCSPEGRPMVEVIDDGPGIAPEDRERVFDRFYRSSEDRRLPSRGTGLGLAIARSAVETNGGRLEYQQAPGGGSVFRILFAAAQERA